MATTGSRILQRFEQRLEGAVEGFFARAFRSGLQPVELAKGLQRYADGHRDVTNSGIVVPNEYAFVCHRKDLERLEGYGATLLHELAEVVTASAADNAWQLRGPVVVTLTEGDDVSLGTYRLRGRIAARPSPPQDLAPPAATPEAATPEPEAAEPAAAASPADRPSTSGEGRSADDVPADGRVVSSAEGPSVRVDSGPSAGTIVPLRGSRVVCGRQPDNNIVLDDVTVSRAHAAFVKRGDEWWVLDLGSTNGTKVNGRKAAEHPVRPGDQVQFGDVKVAIVGT